MKTRLMATAVLTLLAPGPLASQAPVTHRLTPERFYNTFSFAHPPALKIRPGDRVITKTIDASGTDWNGKSVAQGPNPQTGPFYVEGAGPGDAIIVTIERLETNRTMASRAVCSRRTSLSRDDRRSCRSRAKRVDLDPSTRRRATPGSIRPTSPAYRAAAAPDARLRGRGAGAQGSGGDGHPRRLRRQHGLRGR